MKLKAYMQLLKDLIKEDPRVLNAEVVTSADDEGNYFTPVVYAPAAGTLANGEFDGVEEGQKPTAVCLN